MTLLTISIGTPDLEAYVAASLLRSCGPSSIQTNSRAFLTIALAAEHVIRNSFLVRLDVLSSDVFAQPFRDLYRDENDPLIFSALRGLDCELLCVAGFIPIRRGVLTHAGLNRHKTESELRQTISIPKIRKNSQQFTAQYHRIPITASQIFL
jgi:hypothetical protein